MKRYQLNLYLSGREGPLYQVFDIEDDENVEDTMDQMQEDIKRLNDEKKWGAIDGCGMHTYFVPSILEAFQVFEIKQPAQGAEIVEFPDATS